MDFMDGVQFQFQLFQLFFFSRCARSINLVDLSPLGDCPGAGVGESGKSFLRYR